MLTDQQHLVDVNSREAHMRTGGRLILISFLACSTPAQAAVVELEGDAQITINEDSQLSRVILRDTSNLQMDGGVAESVSEPTIELLDGSAATFSGGIVKSGRSAAVQANDKARVTILGGTFDGDDVSIELSGESSLVVNSVPVVRCFLMDSS